MQRLMQVGVVSLGKIMGLSGLLLGALVGIPYGLILMLMGMAGATAEEGGAGFAALGIGGGLLLMVAVPLFYGFVLFILGLIYGLILNLVLWLAGGLELEIRPA